MEELLHAAYTPVSYQCRRFLKTEADAEDMTQEILLLIYTKLDTLKEPSAFWGWLGRMTANRCKNALTRTNADLPILEDEDGNNMLDFMENEDRQAVPEEAFDNAETARMITEIIDALPDAQRDCILLYYYDEMSVKEIAEVTGATENTVKSRLNYARKTIKENVLSYEEKQGIRLHSLAPLPLLFYFLRMDAQESVDTQKAAQVVSKAMEQGAAASAASVSGAATSAVRNAAAHALKGISVKTAAVTGAGLLLIGGATAGIVTIISHDKEETVETSAPVETEEPDKEDIPETETPETVPEEIAEEAADQTSQAQEEPLFPAETLASLPYTGDTGQCAMTVAQAEAFAGVLEQCIAESREEGYRTPFCRAALFDAGSGIPALFVAWGEDMYYMNSEYSGGLALEHTEDDYMADVSRIYCWDGKKAEAGADGRLNEIHGDVAVTGKGLLTDTGFYTFTNGKAELSHVYEDFFLYSDTAPSVDKFREYIAEHGVFDGGYDFDTLTEDKWQVYQEGEYIETGGRWCNNEYGSLVSSMDGVFLTRSEAEAAGKDMAWYAADWKLGNGLTWRQDTSYTWAGDWMDAEELAALLRNTAGGTAADTATGTENASPEDAESSTDGNIRRTTLDSRGYDIEIWYEIPAFAEDTDGYKAINAEYEARLDAFMKDESGELADLWEIVEANPPVSESYRYTVSAKVKAQAARYVSVEQIFSMYLGGMDGGEHYYDNYRTDTGERLLLTDLLEEPEEQIKEMITDVLAQADPYTEETGVLNEIKSRDIGEFDFYIADGRIYVCFPPYDLYGMSYGEDAPVEIELPAELKAEWK